MKPISDRAVLTLLARITRASLLLLAALLAVCMAPMELARADDLLDKRVHFDIAAVPLSNALVQFSAQSGVQVAVADADVAHLRSKGLNGDHSVQEALGDLLHDSGLSFSRVGATMVAIRSAPSASTPAVRTASLSGGDAQPVARPAADSGAKTIQLPDVAVIAPRPPSAAELAADSLYQFVVNHGSTHHPAAAGAVGGGLLRWRGGRSETICPETIGLDRGYNAFVSARVRAVAGFVGAPVHSDSSCKPNVQVLFTAHPEQAMKSVLNWGAKSLSVKFPHQMDKELEVSGEHTIQGWYITAGGGWTVLNRDPGLVGGIDLQGLWPRVIPTGGSSNDANRSILSVIVVIDINKIAGATVGSIADYVAMIALTVVQTPDHCDPLPSILDLMSPSCTSREKPMALTAGDIAFLKALYYRNTGLDWTPSRDDIVKDMTDQFKSGHY
jgi:hypothetical protein